MCKKVNPVPYLFNHLLYSILYYLTYGQGKHCSNELDYKKTLHAYISTLIISDKHNVVYKAIGSPTNF